MSEALRAALELLSALDAWRELTAVQRRDASIEDLWDAEEALRSALSTPDPTCVWSQDDEGNWNTSCDQIHVLIDGTPTDNGMRYCCYCGGAMNSSATLTRSDHFSQTAKMVSDNSEPSREPTQEQVEAWRREASKKHMGGSLNHEDCVATLAHAAGYDAGRMAGGKDAERWREAINHVGAERTNNGCDQRFTLTYLYWPHDIMKGSVAEHFTRCIDAAIAKEPKS